MQQHCWVRAVQLEHNPSAWANLGMLYLRWGLDNQVCTAVASQGRRGSARSSCVQAPTVHLTFVLLLLLALLVLAGHIPGYRFGRKTCRATLFFVVWETWGRFSLLKSCLDPRTMNDVAAAPQM